MNRTARYAAAFVLSALVGGAIQQALLRHVLLGEIIVLIAAILVFSLIYLIIDRCAKSVRVLDWTTAGLIGPLIAVSVAVLVIDRMGSSHGKNIIMLLAVFAVVGFLLPCAAAVLIHWWLLRRRWRTQAA
jgi:hypothetical protein